MRKKTPVIRRSQSPTRDRSSGSQLFGRPSSRPTRTYGRNSQSPSQRRTVSASSMSLRRNHPVASFATHHTHNLELDNEEPVLLPDTPSHAPTPTPLLTRPPNVSTHNVLLPC